MTLLSDLLDFPFIYAILPEQLISLRKMGNIAIDETKSQIDNKSEGAVVD